MFNTLLAIMVAIFVIEVLRPSSIRRASNSLRTGRNLKWLVPAIVWAAFIGFLLFYVAYFGWLVRIHDIPLAVNDAVAGSESGLNPYVDNIVPRFIGSHPEIDPTTDLGTYNYLPFDLYVYSGIHRLIGAIGYPIWFVGANIVFCGLALFLLHDFAPMKWRVFAPFSAIVVLFFSFDNASLTLLLVAVSLYSLKNMRRNGELIAVLVMGLAAMTKVYAALPFAALVIWLLQKNINLRRHFETAKVAGATGVSACVSAALMLPFGILNVLDSAVFFHMSASERVGTNSGGTILSELVHDGSQFSYLAIIAVLISLLLSMWVPGLSEKMALPSIVFMSVAVKSSYALMTIPGALLFLSVWQLSRQEQEASRSMGPQTLPRYQQILHRLRSLLDRF